MIGVIGAEEVPQSGIWREASKKAGKVIEYRNTYRYLLFDEIDETVKTVQALDGLLLKTQYDVPWRKEIFDCWHLYDISHCFECRKKDTQLVSPIRKNHGSYMHAAMSLIQTSIHITFKNLLGNILKQT